MGRREGRSDPKEAALAQARCLTPHPEQVRDPAFLASEFFDARDAVQVKYEMVRQVKADGAPVTAAAAAFGYSRPAYYDAAAAPERSGLEGLVPARPGPRGPHKLTAPILTRAEPQLPPRPRPPPPPPAPRLTARPPRPARAPPRGPRPPAPGGRPAPQRAGGPRPPRARHHQPVPVTIPSH